MPELPEIESLRLKLVPKLVGATFARVDKRRPDLRYPLPRDLEARLKGRRVLEVRRRSKYLLIDVAGGTTLVIHLGMTGRLFFAAPELKLDRHDHVIFGLTDGRTLRFRDPRRFGMIFLCTTAELPKNKFFRHLGLEPLAGEFTAEALFRLCRRSRSPIKNFLMHAAHVVGVGNIYASEALFLSGVRPTRRFERITRAEAEKIRANVRRVLSASIAAGGTTFRDYADDDLKPGLYHVQLHVYGREAEPCPVCGSPIKRTVQAGRSSFYCALCQK